MVRDARATEWVEVRALDVAARPAASAVLEDENLTRLILGSLDENWEWRAMWPRGALTLLQATSTCKRWHKMDLNSVWKQLVLLRWPGAAKLDVRNFKKFYRSHHVALLTSRATYTPDWQATESQDPADIQFLVDMGLGDGDCTILSVVLEGSDAKGLPLALFKEVREDPDEDHLGNEGLGWTVHPLVDVLRANVHGEGRLRELRDTFRESFDADGAEVYLTLTAFRKSDHASCVLVDNSMPGTMHAGYLEGGEKNRVAFEKHAHPLSGSELRLYKCTATFGYLYTWDGEEDEEPTWVFGFDIHKADAKIDVLNTEWMWKALTLVEWS
jgi:hypothetical protein